MTEEVDGGRELSRRDRKRLATRKELVDAAMALFADKGFDQVTVTEIAERADVDPSTFFRHFGSKEAVLFTDMEAFVRHAERMLERAKLPESGSLLAALYDGTSSLAVQERFDPALELLRGRLQASSPEIQAQSLVHREELVAAVARGIAHQLDVDPDEDVVPYLVATLWISAFDWFRRRAVAEDRPASDVRVVIDEVISTIKKTAELLADD